MGIENLLTENFKQQRTLDSVSILENYPTNIELPKDATHIVRSNNKYLIKQCYNENLIGKKWVKVQSNKVTIYEKKSGENVYNWHYES